MIHPLPSADSPKPIAFGVGCLVLVLALVNIVISSQVSYWGYEIGELSHQALALSEANRLLTSDLSRQTSLTKIAAQADTLGYSSQLLVINLNGPSQVALSPLSQP